MKTVYIESNVNGCFLKKKVLTLLGVKQYLLKLNVDMWVQIKKLNMYALRKMDFRKRVGCRWASVQFC